MVSVEALASATAPPGFEAFLRLDQSLLDALPSAIYVCSADGIIVRFNRRAAAIWGRAPRTGDSDERFSGAFRLYRMDGRSLQHADTPMEAALRSGKPQQDREVLIEHPDGSRVIALVNVEAFTAEDGTVKGAVACFQDITERKRAEEGSRKNERHFRGLLDAIPAAIYTTDPEGTIDYYNRAAAELAGREPELGKDKWCVTWRLYSADGTPLAHDACPMATALKERRPVRGVEAVAERPDGTRVPFMPFPTPLYDSTGAFTGAVNMLVDISERKAAETRLRDQHRSAEQIQQKLVSIIESSDDAIVSKDLNGIIASWNKGAERVFGYTAAEAIGRPVLMLIPADHQNEEPKILDRIRRGERIEHYETMRRRKDGSLIDISLSISPVKDADGSIVGASKIARDITERKRAQKALAKRVAEQTALYHFTDRLHRAKSLEEIYDAALETISTALGCERASILLLDDAKTMRFVASRNLSEDYRMAVEGHSPWAADETNPQPVCIPDVDLADIPEPLKAAIRGENVGALAFIPLVASGRLIGKFMTYYAGSHIFTQDEADLALNAARQLAFGIQKKRAEQERYENEERLRLATQTGKVGLWEWNMRTNRLSWTDSLYDIHGVDKENFDATVEGFSALIHSEDKARVALAIEASLKDAAPYEIEFRVQRPDGKLAWVFTNATVLREAGKPVRMVGASFDITERKEAEAERALLLAELSHRVKNTLATVISIAQQSFTRGPSPAEFLRSFDGRIRGLAQTHSRLAEGSWSGVWLETIISDELMPYRREDGGNVRVTGSNIHMNAKCAVALGMAFHELATNAAKHGALSDRNGVVDIAWNIEQPANRLRIQWTESGGPAVAPPERSGFGRLLLERALASDLRGEVELDFAQDGLKCVIVFPLSELLAAAN